MRYFKTALGEIRAIEPGQESLIEGEWEELTNEQLQAELNPPLPIDDLATRKRAEIDQARDAAFAAGLPYDIAGEPDVVQTRPQDQINLLGLSSKAQRLIAEGVTDPVMPFRGLSNITRMLTPEQMDAMTLAALAHIESIYQRSWDRKDAIDAALAAEDREGIEAVVW